MKDELLWQQEPAGNVGEGDGVFIINQGNFGSNNASLSYYDKNSGEVYKDVFFNANGTPLGDVAQSMEIRDSLGYIVMNNSGKIHVIDINTFRLTGKITGLISPRFIHFLNDEKAYVTDLYAKAISIVNPQTLNVTGLIDVNNNDSQFYQHPTEQMVQFGKYIYVNCWSFDNKILVIDSDLDVVIDSIEVLKQPQSLIIDRFDKIWTITDGGYDGNPYGYEQPGLIRIDALTLEVEKVYRFDLEDSPSDITLNGSRDTLYFLNRHVYRHPVFIDDFPEIFIESNYSGPVTGGYSAVGIDPSNSDVYVGNSIDNVQPGVVVRYSPAGVPLDTIRVGVAPGAFSFK
jgi:DNA-binding beta-propeller fold protein YncE